jgi:hypothetical protein
VTKTGSTTVEHLLAQIPGVIVLEDMRVRHGNRSDLHHETQINPLVADVDAWGIEAYGFIRSPVDRFFSACNYLKRFPYALVNLFPEKFTPEELPVPVNVSSRKWTLDEWFSMHYQLKDKIRGLTIEDFLNIPQPKLGFVLREQWHWFELGAEVLRYNDFENETRRLISLFGGDPSVNIPNLNAANEFPTVVQYTKTQDIYMTVWQRYQKDYELLIDPYGIEH